MKTVPQLLTVLSAAGASALLASAAEQPQAPWVGNPWASRVAHHCDWVSCFAQFKNALAFLWADLSNRFICRLSKTVLSDQVSSSF